MIGIRDVEVLLIPIEFSSDWTCIPVFGYMSNDTKSVLWDDYFNEYYISKFPLQKLRELYDSDK